MDRSPVATPWRAHPRLRGEHAANGAAQAAETGSSPLTRGAPLGASGFYLRFRLIPAYAGSTEAANSTLAALRAHPRLRGEHGDDVRHD